MRLEESAQGKDPTSGTMSNDTYDDMPSMGEDDDFYEELGQT